MMTKAVIQLIAVIEILMGGALVIAISILQRSTVTRQLSVLETVGDRFESCSLFDAAHKHLERQKATRSIFGDGGYSLPVFTLVIMMTVYSFIVFYGLNGSVEERDIILGGIYVFRLPKEHSHELVASYQAQTLVTIGIAYLTAMVAILLRLIRRINTNDISQTTYYFLALHVLAAVVMSCVMRHILATLPGLSGDDNFPLALMGAAVGLRPDLGAAWIFSELARLSKHRLMRNNPQSDEDSLPGDLGLENIEGLNYEKRSRLQELDIDNSQFLACQNPFMLWTRTSYGLLHIIDWIGQAKLHVLVKSVQLKALRELGVRDIFGYGRFIATDEGRAAAATALALPWAAIVYHSQAIRDDPAVYHLEGLRDLIKAKGCV